jgi:hypothetical protein
LLDLRTAEQHSASIDPSHDLAGQRLICHQLRESAAIAVTLRL